MTADPKRGPRVRNPDLMRAMHTEHRECCLCGRTNRLELHHVLPRGRGGDDVRSNLVWLCAEQHGRITSNDAATRLLLRRHLEARRPDTLSYLNRKMGDGWLQRTHG